MYANELFMLIALVSDTSSCEADVGFASSNAYRLCNKLLYATVRRFLFGYVLNVGWLFNSYFKNTSSVRSSVSVTQAKLNYSLCSGSS